MPSPAKKTVRSTGPKSEQGKAKSSLNAVRHGLTSSRVLPDEIEMVEAFVLELSEHYRPQSPLEVLQIQRIAFCRAKLAKLIDIEVAGREVARREIELHPEVVMARLVQYPEYLRKMVLQEIGQQSVLASLSLQRNELIEICQEVTGFLGLLEGEDDLELCFPKLCAYLDRVPQSREQLPDIGHDQKLMLFAQRLHHLFADEHIGPSSNSSIEDLLRKFARANDLMKWLGARLCDPECKAIRAITRQ